MSANADPLKVGTIISTFSNFIFQNVGARRQNSLSIIYQRTFFGPQSFCCNRKGATSAEFCGVITIPSSIKSAHTLCVGSWWNGVIAGLPFRLYQRCLWTGTAVGRGQTTVATAMAAFQRCIGKPERWRQQQRHWEQGSCFTLFQDIIEPI